MSSFLDEQFKPYSENLDSKKRVYSEMFDKSDAFSPPKKPAHKPEQRGCLVDAQGHMSCTPWEVSKDGYSFRSEKISK